MCHYIITLHEASESMCPCPFNRGAEMSCQDLSLNEKVLVSNQTDIAKKSVFCYREVSVNAYTKPGRSQPSLSPERSKLMRVALSLAECNEPSMHPSVLSSRTTPSSAYLLGMPNKKNPT